MILDHDYYPKSRFLTRDFLLETLAVVFSALYTWLITYGSIWCWPCALIGSGIFIYLVRSKRLYAESVLHTFYFLIAIYGWVTWGQAADFKVITLGLNTNLALIAGGLVASLGVGFLFRKYTIAVWPFIDSFTAVFSIMATFMMIGMVMENWIYFIVVDVISIAMYASRRLYLSALLFAVYTALAINGLITWYNALQAS